MTILLSAPLAGFPFPRYLYSAIDATPDSVYVDGKGDFLGLPGKN